MLALPFIRKLVLFLIIALLRVSLCDAAGLIPGSMAVLEATFEEPEIKAAWEDAVTGAFLDPGLLLKGREETALILAQWREEGDVLLEAIKTADSAALQGISELMEKAWSAYYTFSFDRALGFLNEVDRLLGLPGESRFRSRMAFESGVLGGMILRAKGDPAFSNQFMKAAALDPETSLTPDRYSPEVIAAHGRARGQLIKKGSVPLLVKGRPADARILLDGKTAGYGSGFHGDVLPGLHYLEARAVGYEPWTTRLRVEEWDRPTLDFTLEEAGPVGEPGDFFLGRLEAGDQSYLSLLTEKLGVDYILIPDSREGALKCWIVGRDGLPLGHEVLWERGDDQIVPGARMGRFLLPLRFQWGEAREAVSLQVNLPRSLPLPAGEGDEVREVPAWKKYGPAIVVLVLLGLAVSSSGGGGGGTNVEVTW